MYHDKPHRTYATLAPRSHGIVTQMAGTQRTTMKPHSSTRDRVQGQVPISEVYGSGRLTGFRYRRRLELLTRELFAGETANRTSSVLDLGCGDGTWLRHVAPRIHRGLGIDLGWSNAEAHWSGPEHIEFRAEDFMSSDLAGEQFDLVTCLETLEHCANPAEVLDRAVGLVRSGGRVGVSVPIEHGPSLLLKELTARAIGYARTKDPNSRWSWPEILRASIGDIRLVARERSKTTALTHKGFDYREVVRAFRERFSDVRVVGSPFPLLRFACNVGVIMVGTRRP